MNSLSIISTLTTINATDNKLETANKVLADLNKMKKTKGMPMLAIRRAIKMQDKSIKN